MVKLEEKDGKVYAYTPYNTSFISEAKEIGGKWDTGEKAWAFDPLALPTLRKTLMDCYGEDGETSQDFVNVRITAKQEMSCDRSDVDFAGRPICRATGRDSGAKVCNGVVKESGEMGSDGSVKYWNTWVGEGAVFIVRGVPKTVLDEGRDAKYWKAEILPEEPAADAEALRKELAALDKRRGEIVTLLEKCNDMQAEA